MTLRKVFLFMAIFCMCILVAGYPRQIVRAQTTITVTDYGDSGPGTLRQAISDANSGDLITFQDGFVTVTLASPLVINKDLSIVSSSVVYLSGDNKTQVIINNPGINLHFSRICIEYGYGDNGGGMVNNGALSLDQTSFEYNTATQAGGGIYNTGTITGDSGGGAFWYNTAPNGGGLYNTEQGSIWLADMNLANNSASNAGGAIDNIGTVSGFTRLTFDNNTAVLGAGIYNSGSILITDSVLYENTASTAGGAIYDSGTTNIRYVTIVDNAAPSGADIYAQDPVSSSLINSIISNSTGPGNNCVGTDSYSVSHDLTWPGEACPGKVADPNLQLQAVLLTIAPIALGPGSAAINAADPAYCTSDYYDRVDEPGKGRPIGPACDIGSDESELGADTIPPTTSITLDPQHPNVNNWYHLDVTVVISASDNPGGTGIYQTRCVLDPVAVPSTFDDLPNSCDFGGTGAEITSEGQHVLYFASMDDAANKEPLNSQDIFIDKTPPTLNPVITPNPIGLHGSASVTLNAEDSLSGLASASCAPIDTATTGSKQIACTATDNAGNENSVNVDYRVVYQLWLPIIYR